MRNFIFSFDWGKYFIIIEVSQWLGFYKGREFLGYATETYYQVGWFHIRVQHPTIRGIVKNDQA